MIGIELVGHLRPKGAMFQCGRDAWGKGGHQTFSHPYNSQRSYSTLVES